MAALIHSTAIVEEGVSIGDRTSVWDNVHVRSPSEIGSDCIIGEKTYIAYDVSIADRVKINSHVYICAGVTVETGVMISAGVMFTNDRFPRATTTDLAELLPSEPDESTVSTTVEAGATIGAGAVIGPGSHIGRFAMVGMGSVITRPVPAFSLVVGNPGRVAGAVCRCGTPFLRADAGGSLDSGEYKCDRCGLVFAVEESEVVEVV